MLVFGAIALYAHTQTQVNKKIYLNKATLFEHLNSIREIMIHRYYISFHDTRNLNQCDHHNIIATQ